MTIKTVFSPSFSTMREQLEYIRFCIFRVLRQSTPLRAVSKYLPGYLSSLGRYLKGAAVFLYIIFYTGRWRSLGNSLTRRTIDTRLNVGKSRGSQWVKYKLQKKNEKNVQTGNLSRLCVLFLRTFSDKSRNKYPTKIQ